MQGGGWGYAGRGAGRGQRFTPHPGPLPWGEGVWIPAGAGMTEGEEGGARTMTLRAGIVGCGGISRNHAAAYAHLEAVGLVALCDINPAALDERANEHGVANRYSDYEEMFARERLDVVSVCTHAPLHTPVTLAAARAGVNVLCEKPLALDLERADRMRAACMAAGVQLAVSHQFRFTPLFRQAKQWIAAGRIGELRAIREVGKGRPAGFELMEMGVHYFDEMEFFLDGIEWVHAQVSYEGRAVGVEDIMPSRQLCPTDRRDNGLVAGDTMLVHLGSPHGAYGLMELYVRGSVHDWLMGPHLLGSEGQLMIKPHRGRGRAVVLPIGRVVRGAHPGRGSGWPAPIRRPVASTARRGRRGIRFGASAIWSRPSAPAVPRSWAGRGHSRRWNA